MSIESIKAVNNSYQFECKQDGFSKLQSGNIKLTITVNQDDINRDFSRLLTDPMGQRYMCVMVPINEDETPRETPVEKPKSYAGQAKMMAQEAGFSTFLGFASTLPGAAEVHLKKRCEITSCSELIEGTEAGKKFKRLQAEYLNWKNQ